MDSSSLKIWGRMEASLQLEISEGSPDLKTGVTAGLPHSRKNTFVE